MSLIWGYDAQKYYCSTGKRKNNFTLYENETLDGKYDGFRIWILFPCRKLLQILWKKL